jgi:hypothetical protein
LFVADFWNKDLMDEEHELQQLNLPGFKIIHVCCFNITVEALLCLSYSYEFVISRLTLRLPD